MRNASSRGATSVWAFGAIGALLTALLLPAIRSWHEQVGHSHRAEAVVAHPPTECPGTPADHPRPVPGPHDDPDCPTCQTLALSPHATFSFAERLLHVVPAVPAEGPDRERTPGTLVGVTPRSSRGPPAV